MNHSQLFSRRPTPQKVDFRPDVDPASPFVQLRRLAAHLTQNEPKPDDLSDCPDALNYLREYTYRKVFTGTTHEDFVKLDKHSPQAIDWLIAVHEVETAHFQNRKNR